MTRIIQPPYIGSYTDPGGRLHADERALKERNLLIPGKQPVGSVELSGHSINNGVVARVLFNKPTLSMRDISIYGSEAAIHNATVDQFNSNSNGLYFEFDGSNDYISIPHRSSLSLDAGLTLSVWVNLSAWLSSGKWTGFIVKGGNTEAAGDNHNYGLIMERTLFTSEKGHTIGLIMETSTGANNYGYYDIDVEFALGEWNHIVGTWDGSTIRTYVNAVEGAYSASFSGTPDTGAKNVVMGRPVSDGFGSNNAYYAGGMTNVTIMNRALSHAEIVSLYKDSYLGIQASG